MATRIVELFGHNPISQHKAAKDHRSSQLCPFIESPCQKLLSNSDRSGVCTLFSNKHGHVICCPYRLYADQRKIFHDVANAAFGPHQRLSFIAETEQKHHDGDVVLIKEVPIPGRSKSTHAYVDWVLAKMNGGGEIISFVSLELQTIDTTGNYREERDGYLNGSPTGKLSTAGFNWENVNKRLIPQLLLKGAALQRERLCHKGMFLVCSSQIAQRIMQQAIEHDLTMADPHPGSITILGYDVSESVQKKDVLPLNMIHNYTLNLSELEILINGEGGSEGLVYEKAFYKKYRSITAEQVRN